MNSIPDPHLHAHCFAFNATYDGVEDQWKAAQYGKLKNDAYYWQAVQQARFANKLQELGYSVHRTDNAFEIDAIPKATLDKFSRRTEQIERTAAALGVEARE